jgi:hypothetical protein
MNIKEPMNCRVLSILIQNVAGEDRDQFLEDAKGASDMKEFMYGMAKYKRISSKGA